MAGEPVNFDVSVLLGQELQDFLHKNLLTTTTDIHSCLDDVVLNYLADTVSSFNGEEEEEHFEQFMEIITEYVTEFSKIERSVIHDWFTALATSLSQTRSEETVEKLCAKRDSGNKKHQKDGTKKKHESSNCRHKNTDLLNQLQPMSVTAAAPEDKEYILSKFSHVRNVASCHHPVLPKEEPKKMVRYRDNQVVTTKGEKYTLQKTPETEEMKRTYVNLKPLRKYRFH